VQDAHTIQLDVLSVGLRVQFMVATIDLLSDKGAKEGAMRFGTRVIVRRGGNPNRTPSDGGLRDVPGVLIGAYYNQLLVKLNYLDGPHDEYLKGSNNMWFSRSAVRPYDRIVPQQELIDQFNSADGG